jgi:hypothetical protein
MVVLIMLCLLFECTAAATALTVRADDTNGEQAVWHG